MSINQCTNSSPDPSTKFSILDLKSQAVRFPVSKGAESSSPNSSPGPVSEDTAGGRVPKIAKDLGWSASSVWRRSAELQDARLLEVIPRAGRSNYWVPLPGRTKMERLRFELTPLATPRGPFFKRKGKN